MAQLDLQGAAWQCWTPLTGRPGNTLAAIEFDGSAGRALVTAQNALTQVGLGNVLPTDIVYAAGSFNEMGPDSVSNQASRNQVQPRTMRLSISH